MLQVKRDRKICFISPHSHTHTESMSMSTIISSVVNTHMTLGTYLPTCSFTSAHLKSKHIIHIALNKIPEQFTVCATKYWRNAKSNRELVWINQQLDRTFSIQDCSRLVRKLAHSLHRTWFYRSHTIYLLNFHERNCNKNSFALKREIDCRTYEGWNWTKEWESHTFIFNILCWVIDFEPPFPYVCEWRPPSRHTFQIFPLILDESVLSFIFFHIFFVFSFASLPSRCMNMYMYTAMNTYEKYHAINQFFVCSALTIFLWLFWRKSFLAATGTTTAITTTTIQIMN